MSSGNDRPKPRLAPGPAALAANQQDALQRLKSLEGWTEQPTIPPPAAAPSQPAGENPATPDAPAAADKSKMPWQVPSPKETHPYHIILSESLFQKIDYVWKRSNERSAKAFVLKALEDAADQALRDMGIEP